MIGPRWQLMRWLPLSPAVVAALSLAGYGRSDLGETQQVEKVPPITEAAAVRALLAEEAAKELPVRLRGVVTFFDPVRRYAFLQDATAGIFFWPGALTLPGPLALAMGELVEIEGVTLPGGFAPMVEGVKRSTPVKATLLGRAPLPEPAAIRWDALNDDTFHNRYVEMRGVIRATRIDPEHANLVLEVSTRGGIVHAFVPGFDAASARFPAEWIDVEAGLRGVFSVVGNAQRQRSELRLYVQTLEQISPDFAAVAKAFAEPPREFQTLLRFDGGRSPEQRVHLEGVVTHYLPGRGVYVRDGGRGLWVQSPQRIETTPGDRMGAIGFAALAEERTILQDAILRKGGRETTPEPVALTVAQARSGLHHGDLVQLQGELFEEKHWAGGSALVIVSEGQRFQAELPAVMQKRRGMKANNWLRVSGICLNEPPLPGAAAGTATDFRILLRSPGDLVVLREAPWWTPQRVVAVIGGLLAVTVGVTAWGLMLRRLVAQQTAIIQQKLEREVVWEERNRIARELHDTLEQHLAAITMQLESVNAQPAELPPAARESLGLMRGMIAHTRGEARRSVWDLRSHTLEQSGLAEALRELAATLVGGAERKIEVRTEGAVRRLDRQIEFHFLRAGQEAMTNAVKHAGATHVAVEVEYSAEAVELRVIDDGCGFDPKVLPGSNDAHFGLLGMRERATKMNGDLRVVSAPGKGTTISLRVPPAVTHFS